MCYEGKLTLRHEKRGTNLIWGILGEGFPEEVAFKQRSEEMNSCHLFDEMKTLLVQIKLHFLISTNN